jgi:hypothetical protein
MLFGSSDHCQSALKMRECFLWASPWKRIRQKVTGVNSKKENEFLRVSRVKKGRPGILSRLMWVLIFWVPFVSRQKGTDKQKTRERP